VDLAEVARQTVENVKAEAQRRDIAIQVEVPSGSSIQADLHIVVDGELTVRAGHDIAKAVESRLIREIDELVDVVVHVEPPEEALPEECLDVSSKQAGP
jgi:divalent metal cation (Fe/Co/Zn/Cd) transporter